MKGLFKMCVALSIGFIVTMTGFWLGYKIYSPSDDNPMVYASDITNIALQPAEQAVVEEDTVIRYIYMYKGDGMEEIYEDMPPYYMLGKNEEELRLKLDKWQIDSFDSEMVVLSKEVEGKSNQHYVIKDYNGYVAVYYNVDGNIDNLKEVTNTPTVSLGEYERKGITEGIYVDGRQNLLKIIENLES